jgi:hypothetical protein
MKVISLNWGIFLFSALCQGMAQMNQLLNGKPLVCEKCCGRRELENSPHWPNHAEKDSEIKGSTYKWPTPEEWKQFYINRNEQIRKMLEETKDQAEVTQKGAKILKKKAVAEDKIPNDLLVKKRKGGIFIKATQCDLIIKKCPDGLLIKKATEKENGEATQVANEDETIKEKDQATFIKAPTQLIAKKKENQGQLSKAGGNRNFIAQQNQKKSQRPLTKEEYNAQIKKQSEKVNNSSIISTEPAQNQYQTAYSTFFNEAERRESLKIPLFLSPKKEANIPKRNDQNYALFAPSYNQKPVQMKKPEATNLNLDSSFSIDGERISHNDAYTEDHSKALEHCDYHGRKERGPKMKKQKTSAYERRISLPFDIDDENSKEGGNEFKEFGYKIKNLFQMRNLDYCIDKIEHFRKNIFQ